jgi:EmrB/QacA subfamily drug resistance transporter
MVDPGSVPLEPVGALAVPAGPEWPRGEAAARAQARRRGWVLVVTSLAAFMAFLDATIVNVAFPSIEASFPAVARSWLSWVLNGYNVVFAALLIPAGQIGDRWGRRRVFTVGLVAFTVASLLCALAPSAGALVGFRVVQAAGAALLVPTSLALLLAEYPLHRRVEAIALMGAGAAVAAAIGPSLGGVLVHASSWRLVFLVNLPLGALTLALGCRVLREQRDGEPAQQPQDFIGVGLLTAGIALVALALTQGPDWGWGDVRVAGSLAAAAVLMAAFGAHLRRRRSHPDGLALLGRRSVRVANAALLLFAAAFFGKILTDVLFLTSIWHYSLLTTGAAITPGPLITALLAKPAGRMAGRHGVAAVAGVGALVYALGCAWYTVRTGDHPSYLDGWLPGTLLTGAGIALAFPTLTSAAVSGLPAHLYGVGSAINATARQLGGVLGVAAVIAILGRPELASGRSVFVTAWTYSALAAAVGAVVAFRLE